MKINIIFALEDTCNVLCNSIIRSWKIVRYTRFIIMRPRVQSPVPLQKKHFGFLQNAFFFCSLVCELFIVVIVFLGRFG